MRPQVRLHLDAAGKDVLLHWLPDGPAAGAGGGGGGVAVVLVALMLQVVVVVMWCGDIAGIVRGCSG